MSLFFQDKEGTEKVLAILEQIEDLANHFSSVDANKQKMYLQGMNLWTEDLQEAIEELGNSSTTTNSTSK